MKKIYNKPEIYVKALALETVMYTTTIANGDNGDNKPVDAKRYNYIVDDDEYDDF